MLKIYDKLDDVPETLREHYKLIEGKYVPEISDDHPVKLNNVKLLNEKTTAETKAAGLETSNASLKADLESAKAHSLPRGHRAIPVADVEAMEKLKEHGTATEIVSKLTEHKTLKEESAQRKRETDLRAVAKGLGYENVDAFVRLPGLNNVEFENKSKDGKDNWISKVKDDQGTVTEKPAQEFIESSADIAPFLAALKSQGGGTRVPEQRKDTGGGSNDIYSRLRQDVKDTQPPSSLATVESRFGFAKTA